MRAATRGRTPPAAPSVDVLPAAPAETKRELTADETAAAPWGATFQASKGWSMTTRDDAVVMEPPEHDLNVTLLELTDLDADNAIAAAWKRVDPAFARATKAHHAAGPRRLGRSHADPLRDPRRREPTRRRDRP